MKQVCWILACGTQEVGIAVQRLVEVQEFALLHLVITNARRVQHAKVRAETRVGRLIVLGVPVNPHAAA